MESSGRQSAGAFIQTQLWQSRGAGNISDTRGLLLSLAPTTFIRVAIAQLEAAKMPAASSIPHAVISQTDWGSHIDNLKIRYLYIRQIASTKVHVGILCFRICVALRSKCNIAAV